MRLSIIIVNFKSSDYIIDCLESSFSYLMDKTNYEWIIVDNASNDNSKEKIISKYPFVKWIGLAENVGFARANNQGMQVAKGECILLLNPDTLLKPGAIETAVNRLIQSNHVACGVQLVYPDLQAQFSGSYFVKGGLNHLLPIPYWGSIVKLMANGFIKKKPAIISVSKEQLVDWVSGAFLMVKREAIDQAGMMDEDFFLYAEEVEWCARLRKLGTICLYGDVQVVHLIGTSIQAASNAKDNSYTNLSDKKGFQLMVSNHLRIRKQYGVIWFLFQLLNYTWGVPFAWMASFFIQIISLKNPFKEYQKLKGYTINVLRLWTLLPIMISGKPHFYKYL